MKIAVCLKQVVSREWHARLNGEHTGVLDTDASWTMNEPDAYALEAALGLAEAHQAEVVAVSAGPARVTQMLRDALARGATRAIHIADDRLAYADALTTSAALAEALRPESCDLILTGLQSDDCGFGATGVMLAGRLGMSHATIVMQIELNGFAVRVKRELEGGWFQWISMPVPALFTIQSGIAPLRYATLRGIMAAKKKEIRTVTPAALDLPKVSWRLEEPLRTRTAQLVGGSAAEAGAALVELLRRDGHL
jgi:electron transfer flavoprotein beta subunit